MPNDVVLSAGSQPTVARVIDIHCDNTEHNRRQHKYTMRDCLRGFQSFLQGLHPRGTLLDARDRRNKAKLEHAAYRRLLTDLESVPKESSWDAAKIMIHAALLAVFLVALVAVVSIHRVRTKQVLHLKIPSWVALLMLAVSGLPCIQFVTRVVSEPLLWYRIRRTRKYTMYVARKMKMSFDVTLWLLLVLGVWYTWCRPQIVKDTRGAKTLGIPIQQYEVGLKTAAKQITRFLMALTLGAFLWMLKTALYVRLNGNIHYKDLCPLIRRTILDFYAIQIIAPDEQNTSRSLIEDADGSDWMEKSKNKMFWIDVSYLNKGSTPIWILKNLCALYREHMMNRKPKILLDLASTHDEEKFIDSAKYLYQEYLKRQKKLLLTYDDFEKCGINPDLENSKLDIAFKMFYFDYQPQITEVKFQRWAVRALKGCLRMERILESSRHIFKKLNLLMICSVAIVVLIVWLLISEIITTTQLAILFAPFVSASFVFGESLKKTFDGLIFVFGMHPFDVDQRVIIDDVQMKVTQLKLLTTVLFVYETGDEVVYPNSVLATKSITKQDHTKYMQDFLEFTIPIDTSEELITDLMIRIRISLDDELIFTSDIEIAKKEISETNITMIIHFKYLVSYKSAEIKARHRSKILEKIVRFREEMKRVHDKEKAIVNKQDEYEVDDNVRYLIKGSMMNLSEIEKLQKKITEILQDCMSSRDFSRVLFKSVDGGKITLGVHIMMKKDLVKPNDKEDLKQQLQELKKEYKVFLVDENPDASIHNSSSAFGS